MNRNERYNRSPKGRARYARYRATDKGHANERKVLGRRTARRRDDQMTNIEKELSHT